LSARTILGRILITASIIAALATSLWTHWTTGHMADAAWPPHARYHLLLYDGTMALFGAAALWCLWGPRRDEWLALRGATFTVLAYFVPLFPATLFPTASVYATSGLAAEGGLPPNLIFAGAMIVLSLSGYGLARRGDGTGSRGEISRPRPTVEASDAERGVAADPVRREKWKR
jgi:hypothetical protein